MSKNLSELSGRKGLRENLFDELGIAASQTGTPTAEKMDSLAEKFLMGKANISLQLIVNWNITTVVQ